MDDDVELDVVDPLTLAVKHDKWSFVVLAVDLAACLTRQVADTLETGTILLSQHRLHKREENEFFEIVRGE